MKNAPPPLKYGPKYHDCLMRDKKTQAIKLGPYVKRSERNNWGNTIEDIIRGLSPYPASYDVSTPQPNEFNTYSYTELAGGMWVRTSSYEINCRIIEAASKVNSFEAIELADKYANAITDKYEQPNKPVMYPKQICFLPGQNLLEIVDKMYIRKLVNENPDLYFKAHPVTSPEVVSDIANNVGWHRLISPDTVALDLLKNAEVIYSHSGSETAITAFAMSKQVVNITNYAVEGVGCYHSVQRVLYNAARIGGPEQAKKVLGNLLDCEWSGILMPWMTNEEVERRLKAYYQKSLEFNDLYRRLSAPVGNMFKHLAESERRHEEKQNRR